jgi:hypothetical protein
MAGVVALEKISDGYVQAVSLNPRAMGVSRLENPTHSLIPVTFSVNISSTSPLAMVP